MELLAESRGSDSSTIWREALRCYLVSDRLTAEEKEAVHPFLTLKVDSDLEQTRQGKREI